ncbi:hypothetical protein CWE09_11405 [Aliidiomarina minuta]|uniref:GIY-YIG domain-containing protein n=1 Tax=Aliidiomarina minuta TaxID=880057 RepID=A0A432W4X6_9GAMM|nr:GIY-YIG nuclease family protein [Aliidiomarina minuta]RUO24457.1 hypothetical protein CWE09_11405 [Aliidiomarina minuta]
MTEEFEIIAKLFANLEAARAEPFPNQRKQLLAPTNKCVYVVIDPDGAVLHVGQTPRGKGGLYQRLRNHLQGQSSFVRAYFAGDGSQLRSGHSFKYIEVEDSRLRALLESYTVGRLGPAHLGVG